MLAEGVHMFLTPQVEVLEKHCNSSNADLLLSMCLDALAEACLNTASLAALHTLLLSFLANLGFAHCANHPESRRFPRTPDNSEAYTPVKASARSELGTAVTGNDHICFMDLRCFETTVVGKSALQAYNFNSLADWCAFEAEKQWVQCRWNGIEPSFSPQPMTPMSCCASKDSSLSSCNARGNYRFVEGPDTNVRLSRKEINAWLAVAKNKDDEGDDDNDDKDDDDEDEGDDDDEGDGEGAGDEEGEEGVEGGEGDKDREGGDDDDDDDDDDEEGDDEDEEEEEAGEGEEEEEDEDGVEGEEGDDEDDEGDEEDEDEDDETSEPPKKKRK